MAAPANPTVTDIVTQALKRAGRTTPSSTQIQEAIDHALQEVKSDIMLVAPTHRNLVLTATTVTTKGQQRYAVPEDWNEQKSITLLDGPDEWRGTAQGGSQSAIILTSTMNVQADDIIGKYILVTSGVGVEGYREIIAYDASTRTATVDLGWESVPTSSSTYLVVQVHKQLWPTDTDTEFDREWVPTSLGQPYYASLLGQEFLLYPVPDKSTYGLINRYYCDLSKLDEVGDIFVQLLREWRSIWIQGVAVKSMQRYDEDRYQSELSVYKYMLDSLASDTCIVSTVRQND